MAPASWLDFAPVVVDDLRTVDELPTSIILNIGDREAMVALSSIGMILWRGAAMEHPAQLERAVDGALGCKYRAGAIAAAHN